MAQTYVCDNDDGNTAAFTVSNQITGDTMFVCPLCFSMLGAAMLKELYPEVWAETTAPPAPAPKARAKRGAKAAEVEPDESARTVAEIVETGPREDGPAGEREFVLDSADNTLKTSAEFAADHADDDPPSY